VTRRWLLVGAAAIVCLTNLAALGLGALNRRGATDAPITLTERELPFYNYGPDSTATELRFGWASLDNAGFPCDKIRPLGFTCPDQPVPSDSRVFRQPPRNGYVVLEYDGPAWEQVRKRSEAQAAEFRARNPSSAPAYDSSLNNQSHLVPIDIGPDAAALRRSYPDASRYLISTARIAARVSAFREPPQTSTLAGFVMELLPSTINVPLPFSTIIRRAAESHSADPPPSWTPRYTVTLRHGRFQEPWIVDVSGQ
jgi:uncharacterized protein DUF4824